MLQDNVGNTYLNAASTKAILFRINNTDQMYISSGGNVGIGSTTPGSRLDVSGGAHVSDSFAVGGAAGDSLVVCKRLAD